MILASGVLLLAWCGSASAGTLEDIRSRGALQIAYRDDAPPMSYKKSDSAVPVGYMVDLCRAVAEGIGKQISNAALKVERPWPLLPAPARGPAARLSDAVPEKYWRWPLLGFFGTGLTFYVVQLFRRSN